MKKLYYNKGLTLIEMIIVIIVLLIITATATTVLVQQFQLFTKGQELANADWQGRIAIDRMVRDIRNAIKINDIGKNKTLISFQNYQDKKLTYELRGDQIFIESKGTPKHFVLPYTPYIERTSEENALADNIRTLKFDGFDEDGNPTNVIEKMYYVTITLKVAGDSKNKKGRSDFELTTSVYLWNIRN